MTTVHNWQEDVGHYFSNPETKMVRTHGGDLTHEDGRTLETWNKKIKPGEYTTKELDNLTQTL
jgi:hypothetical protein